MVIEIYTFIQQLNSCMRICLSHGKVYLLAISVGDHWSVVELKKKPPVLEITIFCFPICCSSHEVYVICNHILEENKS